MNNRQQRDERLERRRRRRAGHGTGGAIALTAAAAVALAVCTAPTPATAAATAFCYSTGGAAGLWAQQRPRIAPNPSAASAAGGAREGGAAKPLSALSRLLLFRGRGQSQQRKAGPPPASLYKDEDAAVPVSSLPSMAAAAAMAGISPPQQQQALGGSWRPQAAQQWQQGAEGEERREYVKVQELSHPLKQRSLREGLAHFGMRFREAVSGATRQKKVQEAHDYAALHQTEGARPQVWRRLKTICAPECPLLIVSAIAMLAAASVEVMVPHVSSQALSAILLGKGKTEFVFHVKRVIQLGLLAAVTTGIRGLCFGLAGTRIVCRLRHELFKSLLGQEIAFFDGNQSGELTNRLTADCAKISNVVSLNINIMSRQTIQLIGGMLFLYRLHKLMALAAGGGLALLFLIAGVHGRYNRLMGEKIQDALAASNVAAGTSLSLIRVVRTHVGEGVELRKYDEELSRTVDEMAAGDLGYGAFRLFNRVAQTALLGGVLALGYHLTQIGAMSMEQLTSSLFYVNFVMGASYDVGDQWSRIQDAIGSATTVFALLDRKPRMSVKPLLEEGVAASASATTAQQQQHLLERPSLEGILTPPLGDANAQGAEIVFNNISFAYPMRKHKPILQQLDLSIAPGQRVAIVGASGGGKSTLLRLLTRMYDPDPSGGGGSGAIYLDGRDIASMSQEELTSKVAMLSQEPPLLPVSLRDNIAYGLKPGTYTMDDIVAAARAANIHEFISALPDGYDTMVGEGSVGLSGGEKQRVSIARALMRKPRVLLLDEPTSALDAQSEGLVQAALDRAGKGRTVLIVAHRLSTIESCDSIIVLKNGAVVERGSHAELMARPNGVYAALRQQHLTGAAPCP